MKTYAIKALAAASLVVASLSAHAVSFDSAYTLTRNNTAGDFTRVLPPHANHFCYLSKVEVEETDSGNEHARCEVSRSGSVWVFVAELGANGDADVSCSAVCYNN